MYRRGLRFTAALFVLAVIGGQSCARANGVTATLENGKTVNGALSGTGADTYTFKTKKGSSFVITASETSPHNDSFSMDLEINGPGGASMGGGRPVMYRQVMSNVAEGDWTVKIGDGDGTPGTYSLTLLQVPGVAGTRIKFGQQYKGTIKGGALDVYKVSSTPGVTLQINTDIEGPQGFYASILSFDPSGANIGGETTSPGSTGDAQKMTAYGDYILMVGADDSGGSTEGTYTLSITRDSDATTAQQAAAGEQAQQSAQASAQPPPPPSPPQPQAMTVEQVFQQPVIQIYTDKVLPVSEYPFIYEDGMILSFNDDYLVRDVERNKADEGNPLAQLHTGDDYFKTSPKQAVDDFWVKAADQGNVDARNRLGLTYARFHSDQAQKYKAADWYARAVSQGAIDAPVKISTLYHGTEHPQNDAEIVNLATGYAKKGVPEAQYVLGVAYETGQGVKQDYATAESWYRKAAEQNNRNAEYALGKLYTGGHGSPLKPQGSNPVPPDPYYEGVRWFRLASDQGLAAAQFRRATFYLNGYGESIDFAKARALYQSAAEQGLAAAQFNLAVLYAHGLGGETDYVRAGQWYAKAAAQGLILAQNDLAELIEHGAGFAQDYTAAAKWYQLAADAGYPVAQYNLARLYRDGRGVAKDATQAAAWFTKAAAEGHVEAQAELAELNAEIKLLRTAAEQGDNAALQKLVDLYRTNGVKKDEYEDVLALYRDAAIRLNPVAFAGLADLFARKDSPDYPEAYFWYRLTSASIEKWQAFPDEKDALKKYADGEAGKIAGKLLPEQIAVAQWRIADRSPPNPDKQQLAGAALYIQGDLAEKGGHYITAQQYYMAAASDELAAAAYKLGNFYEIGRGLARDMDRAVYYFKKAVRNGRVGAATKLGDMYLYGMGVPIDVAEAEKWYQMDADRGYGRAIDTLGSIYLSGEKNAQTKAIAMYEKAAARARRFNDGPYDALGMIYLYGVGVPKDPKKALAWYQYAGFQTGRVQASWILTNFEPHDYVRAYELLGHTEDPVMYNDLGYLYERGLGIADLKLDFEKSRRPFRSQQPFPKLPTAIELYQRAAAMCYGRAMYHIGRLYQSGVNDPAISAEPIPKNPEMARKWMTQAAGYGSRAAADWLKGEDKNDPSPKAAIEPEMTYPVQSCRHGGGG